jgi:transcriptional regulator with XRE-family HTH domain
MDFPEAPEFTIPMTAERLRWCMAAVGWSRGELARRLNINESTVAHMVQGKRFIPNRIAIWLDTLANVVLSMPTPHLWQEGRTIGAQRHNAGVQQLEEAWDNEAALRVKGRAPRDGLTHDDAA